MKNTSKLIILVKNNEAVDALKSDIKVNAKMFHVLSRNILQIEQADTNWKEGYLINILK